MGQSYLIGVVWMAIIRSPLTKLSGLKYLNKKVPKGDTDEVYFPSKNSLVVNALISCLEDEN